jgi:hypothetical protein
MKSVNHLGVIATAILMLTLLTSCGGGGSSGGASTTPTATTEVINGITVPVAPDATANATTLKGVDSNNNGVRDDIERLIAQKLADQTLFTGSITLAGYYQKMLTDPTPLDRASAIVQMKGLMCAVGGSDATTKVIKSIVQSGIKMEDSLTNTPERKSKLDAINNVLGAYDGEEIQCD